MGGSAIPDLAHAEGVNSGAVRIELLDLGSQEAFAAVIALGDQNRDRLGQLPYAVFTEAAAQSRLFVAVPTEGGTPLGYALFRLPRDEVSLTHLCVHRQAREHGVAHALIKAISATYASRLGIRAKCRDDYDLADTWIKLGFRPRATTFGRGLDRAPMTVWWKDHGHPDLFTEHEQPVELRAAIDLNVARDLADPKKRGHRSQILVADHLVGRLEIVVTSGMRAEIRSMPAENRQPLIDATARFPHLQADSDQAEAIEQKIITAVQIGHPRYPSTDQDRSDVRQVAHAVAAGLTTFLTQDDALINRLGPVVSEQFSMRIMAPEYVVVHLDELSNEAAYLQQDLDDSEFTRVRAGATIEQELYEFLAHHAGERRNALRDRVRKLIEDGGELWVIRASGGSPVALYGVIDNGKTFEVPLLRLTDHRLADTLARHLLWTFRRAARASGAIVVDISEPCLSPRLAQAADFESMISAEGHWYAPVVDVCGDAGEVAAVAARAHAQAEVGAPPLLAPGLSRHAAARLEQAWWPAKIMDSELPCFIVPIKVAYAHELFGYQSGVIRRDPQLALGREHVYYHSAYRSLLTAPARILWYASGNGAGAGHFFATSRLDALVEDTPERLYADLGYYGVFNKNAVKAAARGRDTAEALRLSNTELFDQPVSERRYQVLRAEHDGPAAFMGVCRMKNVRLYQELYKIGTCRPAVDDNERSSN
ncbi:Acetyltransferase (GNAT) family protein [Lentzea aerocolonigenes]|nr:Acetyltransferase (GNAT) family protein [Lentzea aerocolonigenes]